jgi:hypothetical protein
LKKRLSEVEASIKTELRKKMNRNLRYVTSPGDVFKFWREFFVNLMLRADCIKNTVKEDCALPPSEYKGPPSGPVAAGEDKPSVSACEVCNSASVKSQFVMAAWNYYSSMKEKYLLMKKLGLPKYQIEFMGEIKEQARDFYNWLQSLPPDYFKCPTSCKSESVTLTISNGYWPSERLPKRKSDDCGCKETAIPVPLPPAKIFQAVLESLGLPY